jgi:hypothetical protein
VLQSTVYGAFLCTISPGFPQRFLRVSFWAFLKYLSTNYLQDLCNAGTVGINAACYQKSEFITQVTIIFMIVHE